MYLDLAGIYLILRKMTLTSFGYHFLHEPIDWVKDTFENISTLEQINSIEVQKCYKMTCTFKLFLNWTNWNIEMFEFDYFINNVANI